ncbi:MAG TPA: formyltransferase family protein [Anaerolineales bacterium]|nr:formyltransferase family protein [Anaerolineales bacterium]
MAVRIIAFVDHEIGARLLKKLVSHSQKRLIKLAAVVTTTENGHGWWPGVEDICREFRVPFYRFKEPYDDILSIKEVDWYLLLSWKHLIKENFINQPRNGVINLHYSLLPKFRGVYPVNWAIIEGEKITGITYHLVNNKIDDGQNIVQGEIEIFPSDNARSLQVRLDELAFQLFDELLVYLLDPSLIAKKVVELLQNKQYRSRADFNAICKIDLEKTYSGAEIINLLRGLSYFPDSKNAYFIDAGKKVYLNLTLFEE